MNKSKIKKAIFPVGGLGTRFLPVTKSLPKEMLPVSNMPIIQHVFLEAVNAGIEEFIFITGRNKDIISNHFDRAYELEKCLDEKEKFNILSLTTDWLPDAGKIAFIRQQYPMGLGHAIWCARNFIKDEPFAVLLPDEIFLTKPGTSVLKEMVDIYDANGANIVALAEVEPELTNRYGIVEISSTINNNTFKICDMVEKPAVGQAPSNLSISGRYILQPEIFEVLEQTKKDSSGEIQLTDALKAMLKTTPTYGYKFSGQRFDCGSHYGFLEANIEFGLKNNEIGEDVKKLIINLASKLV